LIQELSGRTLSDRVKVYFTQKIAGNTTCSPVEISSYGAISDWPSDFFDQSQEKTERLLKAAQAKLNRERKRGIVQ
jgi:predicted ATPase